MRLAASWIQPFAVRPEVLGARIWGKENGFGKGEQLGQQFLYHRWKQWLSAIGSKEVATVPITFGQFLDTCSGIVARYVLTQLNASIPSLLARFTKRSQADLRALQKHMVVREAALGIPSNVVEPTVFAPSKW